MANASLVAPAAASPLDPRSPLATAARRPLVMGVLNVTPDSFSDGGARLDPDAAVGAALRLAAEGADFIDIGGESTRPGAAPTPVEEELRRVTPVLERLRAEAGAPPVSIDTRKAAVADAAFDLGARVFNDVSALTHDPDSLAVARRYADAGGAVCLMHAQGDPETMQADPRYDDVVREVRDWLAERIRVAEAAGIPRGALILDPGIGFGKTLAHNLSLIRGLDEIAALGPPVLLGVSRKGFIGLLSGEAVATRRAPGSIAAGLAGVAKGARILRVHDVAETVQALRVWTGVMEDERETSA